VLTLGFDQSLVDEEGFPKANLDFGELTIYRNLKRTFNGNSFVVTNREEQRLQYVNEARRGK
jgi:hypothetical protein